MNRNRLEELRVINNYHGEKVWVEYKRKLLDSFFTQLI